MNYEEAEDVRRAARAASAKLEHAMGDTVEPLGLSEKAEALFVRAQLLQLAALAPAASIGTCAKHGRQLLYEGRDDGLWVSCGALGASGSGFRVCTTRPS